jgi:PIN domain nuclease of toxin-antitoxin system
MFLLDTVILVRLANTPRLMVPKLASLGRSRGRPTNARLSACLVSLWEIANKIRSGRLIFPFDIADSPAWLEDNGIALLPLEISHVRRSMDFPIDDPYDRLIYATGQIEKLRLLTTDDKLLALDGVVEI